MGDSLSNQKSYAREGAEKSAIVSRQRLAERGVNPVLLSPKAVLPEVLTQLLGFPDPYCLRLAEQILVPEPAEPHVRRLSQPL